MAYYTGKEREKARGDAMKEVYLEHRTISEVARRFGVHRSTVYRWIKKWQDQQTVELRNYGRPNREPGQVFRWQAVKWKIKTISSAPKTHPNALSSAIVQQVMKERRKKYACAEIIQYNLRKIGIIVSLSSIKRTIKRNELWRKKRLYQPNEKRPLATSPGELVEVDTVHYVNPSDHSRQYIYTVIDLYSRMSYSKVTSHLSQNGALKTVLEAQDYMQFPFKMVQSDNGAEFQRYFQARLNGQNIKTRHTRVRHPNDNAHIERFNRTLRKECIGQYNPNKGIEYVERKLKRFTDYYNHDRIHLGIGLKTPYEMLQRC